MAYRLGVAFLSKSFCRGRPSAVAPVISISDPLIGLDRSVMQYGIAHSPLILQKRACCRVQVIFRTVAHPNRCIRTHGAARADDWKTTFGGGLTRSGRQFAIVPAGPLPPVPIIHHWNSGLGKDERGDPLNRGPAARTSGSAFLIEASKIFSCHEFAGRSQ
jgi:hypothetical protein